MNSVFDEKQSKMGRYCDEDIMNPIIEMIFGIESKLCTCGLEVEH